MYNIIIADDEQLERMVLQQALEEYLGERCTIRVAANGREAVEVALLANADVAILDIEMPGMNGLEAARIISQKIPSCKIIILTAYSEFSYAREAIAIGSADYLLKPCADEDLHRTIDRVLLQIDKQRTGELEKERSTKRIQSLSTQIEEHIVRTVMGGHISSEYITEQMRNYGVHFSNGVFVILHNAKGTVKDTLSALKNTPWPEHIHPFLYAYDGKVYLLNVSDNDNISCLDITLEQLEKLSQAARTLWGHPLLAAVGKGFTNIQYAQLSCFQAQVALALADDKNPISIYEESNDPSESTDNPIISSVLFGDIEEIGKVAAGLVNSLFAQQLGIDATMSQLNYSLAKTVQSLRSQTGVAVSDIVIPSSTDPLEIDSLKHMVASRLCHLADQLAVHGETKDTTHLKQVKNDIEKYVAQHYNEDVFLPGIARAMNYSSAYFSRLFKQCFQRNFITYLTDVRIQAAKDLMWNSHMTIREIGEKVGYKDPNYFTKVFRKVVGQSPSAFRESYGGGDT